MKALYHDKKIKIVAIKFTKTGASLPGLLYHLRTQHPEQHKELNYPNLITLTLFLVLKFYFGFQTLWVGSLSSEQQQHRTKQLLF